MIKRAIDPVTDVEVVMVEGLVERIRIVPAEQTARNLEYGVTHTASLCVDNLWINYISLGIKEGREPNLTINQGTKESPKWVEISEGDKVKVIVQESIKGDKTYYNAKRTGVKLITKGDGGSKSSSEGGKPAYQAKPRDNTGVSVGHSFNGAMNFLLTQGGDVDNDNIVKHANMVHNVTEKLKKITEEKNPEMDAYSVGAMTGNAVLNACKLVGLDTDFEKELQSLASEFLEKVVPKITEYVKGVNEVPPTAVKTTRAPPAKKAVTKAPVAPPVSGFDDMDEGDDSRLPF